jgi:hypothetical protein
VDDLPLGLGSFDMFRARAMTFFAPDIELHIFRFVAFVDLFQFKSGIMTTGTAHFKGLFCRRFLESTILFVPVLEIIRNPPRGGLVPLEGKDKVIVADLDLIALFPSPPPISSHDGISDLFGRVLCIH